MIHQLQERLRKLPDGSTARIDIEKDGKIWLQISYWRKREQYGLQQEIKTFCDGDDSILQVADLLIAVLLKDINADPRPWPVKSKRGV